MSGSVPPAHAAASGALTLRHLHGGRATYRPGETFGPRLLRDYELVWIVSGSATYQANDVSYALGPGSVVLARPGFRELYCWDTKRVTRHAYLHFAFGDIPADWPNEANWPVSRPAASDGLRALFHYLLGSVPALARPGTNAPSKTAARALAALIDLFLAAETSQGERSASQPLAMRVALRWAEERLLESPATRIRLADLAKAAHVSQKHLCRVFAGTSHISPMTAVRALRLEQAASLLERSDLSVKEIAERTGFASPFHFSRAFAREYGAPPSQLRAELRGSPLPRSEPMLGPQSTARS